MLKEDTDIFTCFYTHHYCHIFMYLCSLHVVDAVVRTHFYKYFHPKEALIANGVLNR